MSATGPPSSSMNEGYVPPHMRKGGKQGGGARPPVPWRLRPGAKFLTAGLLALGVGWTFFYTMRSVSQDDFADIDDSGNKIRERPRV
ncbi:uncharacterized protein ACA1_174800 [Acanthamoeba castellanii str. Neff]|uniref:Cytochrome c oxidase assembly factor 3 n=1 Tax=Acanthamoeba castellanii (strain ATCC 30010 / Neff) TaxID=1257118 RepID=L8HJF0_ACACF|nr:uncharacterized protein ACA1_174800 [Acanthamoeba castellanii str. Neff]ELR24818.1 hypothetical protein ACA1_174800 [Acanthamoeba castellanii str. Neff]